MNSHSDKNSQQLLPNSLCQIPKIDAKSSEDPDINCSSQEKISSRWRRKHPSTRILLRTRAKVYLILLHVGSLRSETHTDCRASQISGWNMKNFNDTHKAYTVLWNEKPGTLWIFQHLISVGDMDVEARCDSLCELPKKNRINILR